MVDALKLSKKVKNWTMTVCIADFRYNRSCQLPINLLILGFRNHYSHSKPEVLYLDIGLQSDVVV